MIAKRRPLRDDVVGDILLSLVEKSMLLARLGFLRFCREVILSSGWGEPLLARTESSLLFDRFEDRLLLGRAAILRPEDFSYCCMARRVESKVL